MAIMNLLVGARNHRRFALATIAAVILGACGGSAEQASPGSEAPTVTEILAASGESTIDGVPLPAGAVVDPEYESIYSVEGASYAQVEAFYAKLLPEGQDWKDWQWCEYVPAGYGVLSRGDDLLVVNVQSFDDDPRPYLAIGQDVGPC